MAHKTLINGTAYDIVGGSTLINGTGYRIASGKTLINGTGYDIHFSSGYQWPGWNNATWQDISDLCQAKQNGDIATWPDDVIVNSSQRTLTFAASPSLFSGWSNSTVTVRIRALDELPNTITFSVLCDPTTMTKRPWSASGTVWSTSYVRDYCYQLYESYPENENYIIPVVKRTATNYPNNNNVEDTTEYFFLPAVAEINNHGYRPYNEYSTLEGTVYNNTLIQNQYQSGKWNLADYGSEVQAWTRSKAYAYNKIYTENSTESSNGRNGYFCPFFIIG